MKGGKEGGGVVDCFTGYGNEGCVPTEERIFGAGRVGGRF